MTQSQGKNATWCHIGAATRLEIDPASFSHPFIFLLSSQYYCFTPLLPSLVLFLYNTIWPLSYLIVLQHIGMNWLCYAVKNSEVRKSDWLSLDKVSTRVWINSVTDSRAEVWNLNQLCHRVRGRGMKLGKSFILASLFSDW